MTNYRPKFYLIIYHDLIEENTPLNKTYQLVVEATCKTDALQQFFTMYSPNEFEFRSISRLLSVSRKTLDRLSNKYKIEKGVAE